jgi:hypothetical protein
VPSTLGIVASHHTPWLPSSLGSALKIWLDGSNPGSFTYSSDSVVSQWNDLSGNGLHATQATVTNQPTRDATVNGLAAVHFNGVNSYMTTGNPNIPQPYWIWGGFDINVTKQDADVIGQASPLVLMRPRWNANTWMAYAGATGVSGGPLFPAGVHYWGVYFNGASSLSRLDGAQNDTGDAGTAALNGGGLIIGADPTLANFLDVDCRDVLVVGGSMSGADITNMETYLARSTAP